MLRLPWLRRRTGGERGVYCVFRFPDSTESRWMDQLPEAGMRIRSPIGKVWIVDEVLQSGRDTYTVHCVARRAYVERLRRDRDLAAELLEAARHASEAATERRHRRRMRPRRP